MINFDLDLRVHDKDALRCAAEMRCCEDGMTEVQIIEMLGVVAAPDVLGCVQMLLDPGSLPGCSGLGSYAEVRDELEEFKP